MMTVPSDGTARPFTNNCINDNISASLLLYITTISTQCQDLSLLLLGRIRGESEVWLSHQFQSSKVYCKLT